MGPKKRLLGFLFRCIKIVCGSSRPPRLSWRFQVEKCKLDDDTGRRPARPSALTTTTRRQDKGHFNVVASKQAKAIQHQRDKKRLHCATIHSVALTSSKAGNAPHLRISSASATFFLSHHRLDEHCCSPQSQEAISMTVATIIIRSKLCQIEWTHHLPTTTTANPQLEF